MKKHLIIAASAFALSLSSIAPTAHAQCAFIGCDVETDGTLRHLEAGDVVHVETSFSESVRVQVVQVDAARSRVLVQDGAGRRSWHSASNIYTPGRNTERNGARVVGALAALMAIAAIASSGSSSSQSGSAGSSGMSEQERRALSTSNGSDRGANGEATRSTSSVCYWGYDEYGTCVR